VGSRKEKRYEKRNTSTFEVPRLKARKKNWGRENFTRTGRNENENPRSTNTQVLRRRMLRKRNRRKKTNTTGNLTNPEQRKKKRKDFQNDTKREASSEGITTIVSTGKCQKREAKKTCDNGISRRAKGATLDHQDQ